jgi:type I restriction enzyme R subunit
MQSFRYRDKMTPFPDSAIGAAIRDIDAPLERGLPFASKAIYDSLLYGKSCEVELYDGGRQSFDLSYIDWEHPDNNIWQVTDEFSVERPNGKFARPDIVVMVNESRLLSLSAKKSSVSVKKALNKM